MTERLNPRGENVWRIASLIHPPFHLKFHALVDGGRRITSRLPDTSSLGVGNLEPDARRIILNDHAVTASPGHDSTNPHDSSVASHR